MRAVSNYDIGGTTLSSTAIQKTSSTQKQGQLKTRSSQQLVTELDPRSPISEAYRILQTNLTFMNFDGNIKFLAVTSSMPGEGKSTTAANLAVTLAQAGKQVILVDADLRKPTQHKIFGLVGFAGLTNAIVDGNDPYMLCVEHKIERLRILPAGPIPPNASELLGSKRFKQILERLGEEADFVILDCPPTLGLTDTLVLSKSVDGYLLVVGSGKVDKNALASAKEQLERVGAKVIGAVLNGIDVKEGQGSYYYYYGEAK